MAPMTITVAICTHNRAAYLRKALASLAAQTLADQFDILVVDNASTDDTLAVVRSMHHALPRLRRVHEPQLGLSLARNRALYETSTTYIAYLDDDAIAAPEWVESLLKVFATVQPRPVAVGGPVHPIWLAPRPAWLGDRIRGCLTIVDWGGDGHFIDRREFIVGANMAFQREAVLACSGFDPDLGRIGNRLMSGEEMLLQRHLAARGGRIYYEPAAAVQHHVHSDRLDKRWFYHRFYYEGVSQAFGEVRLRSLGRLQRYRVALGKLASGLRRGRWHQALLGGDEKTRLASRLEAVRTLMTVYTLLQMPEATARRTRLALSHRD